MNGKYSPHEAEILYKQRRSLTGSRHKLLHDTELKEHIELKIKEDDWLPDEVAGRSKLEGYQTISTSTIYRGIAKGGLLTLVDRLSRFHLVEKVKDKSSKSIIEAFNRMKKKISAEYLKTITVDNEKEFTGFKEIEKNLNIDVHFCNPYSPWEKGSNENFNGMLRQTYPKGTVFSSIPDDKLERTVEKIRNRPRKILNYFTANEVFFENMWWCT